MGNNRLFPGIDHRQSSGTQHVPSVIWALYSVGETTTGVVVFFIAIITYHTHGADDAICGHDGYTSSLRRCFV
jgi:hypothetical protein